MAGVIWTNSRISRSLQKSLQSFLPCSEGFWLTKVLTESSSGFTGPSTALSAGPLGHAASPRHLLSSDGLS